MFTVDVHERQKAMALIRHRAENAVFDPEYGMFFSFYPSIKRGVQKAVSRHVYVSYIPMLYFCTWVNEKCDLFCSVFKISGIRVINSLEADEIAGCLTSLGVSLGSILCANAVTVSTIVFKGRINS